MQRNKGGINTAKYEFTLHFIFPDSSDPQGGAGDPSHSEITGAKGGLPAEFFDIKRPVSNSPSSILIFSRDSNVLPICSSLPPTQAYFSLSWTKTKHRLLIS